MVNLRGLLGIRGMDRVPNAQIRELCRVIKGVDERRGHSSVVWPCGKDGEGNGKRVYVYEECW